MYTKSFREMIEAVLMELESPDYNDKMARKAAILGLHWALGEENAKTTTDSDATIRDGDKR